MKFIELRKRLSFYQNEGLSQGYENLENLLGELTGKEIPQPLVLSINEHILLINSFSGTDAKLVKELRKSRNEILSTLQKELQVVPRNYYQRMWVAIGITAFGLPMGVVFGVILDNLACMALALPMGLLFGIIIGSSLDKKAMLSGKQLDIDKQ